MRNILIGIFLMGSAATVAAGPFDNQPSAWPILSAGLQACPAGTVSQDAIISVVYSMTEANGSNDLYGTAVRLGEEGRVFLAMVAQAGLGSELCDRAAELSNSYVEIAKR